MSAAAKTRIENKPKQSRSKGGNPAWVKGRSGNPGGRPKTIGHVRDLAREHTEMAIRTLVEIAGNGDAPSPARVSAATSLLDRGWGKASQPVGGAEDLPPIKSERELTEAQLIAIASGAANSDG